EAVRTTPMTGERRRLRATVSRSWMVAAIAGVESIIAIPLRNPPRKSPKIPTGKEHPSEVSLRARVRGSAFLTGNERQMAVPDPPVDRESLDQLLRRLRPRLKQVLGRYRIPAHDAEDL